MEVGSQWGERRKGAPSSDHEEEGAHLKRSKEKEGTVEVTAAGVEGAEDARVNRDVHPPPA